MNSIGFNKPFLTGQEIDYILEAVSNRHISGNGLFTRKCHAFLKEKYGFNKCMLTTSCTDALEMSALLLDLRAGDEVIVPSFTFVSTATAFVLRNAKIVFVDSCQDHPNIDSSKVEEVITAKTKAIVVVHYGGVACDMGEIMRIASKFNLFVIEDAAQAIDCYYKARALGTLGHLSAFSFHETKNISSGEGGMIVINDKKFESRADVIWEKGTNRKAFHQGEVDKYSWVDIGSSFLPSDLIAAFLFAQLQQLDSIQARRLQIWSRYYSRLRPLELKGSFRLPKIPNYATHNGHIFYLILNDEESRTQLINHLRMKGIQAVFHYQSLHKSPYFQPQHDGRDLPMSDRFSETLVRLPIYHELETESQDRICNEITEFFGGEKS